MPEGIIFQSQGAYVALRKMLVESYLAAVISLPAGVFNPYSGVKTSILILDRAVAKASRSVAFFKITNDGFALGAQRKAIKGSQLAQVKAELEAWLHATQAEGGDELESSIGFSVPRKDLLAEGSVALSSERYVSLGATKSGFPMVSLGEESTFKVEGGGTPKSDVLEYWDGGIPWATLVDLPAANFITEITSTVRTISGAGLKGSAAKLLPVNSVLVSSRATIGRIAINRVSLATNQGFKNIVIVDDTKATAEYVALAVTRLVPTMQRWATGGTFAEISKSKFCELEIPLPPLEVQREIAVEVASYQRVIDGASAVLNNYEPQFPVDPEWPLVELKEVVGFQEGPGILAKDFAPDGVPLVRLAGVQSEIVTLDGCNYLDNNLVETKWRHFKLNKGDILISTSASFGRVSVVTDDAVGAICYTGIIRFWPTSSKIHHGYLRVFLGSENFLSQAASFTSGAVIKHFGPTHLKQMTIPLPPLKVQKQIASDIEVEKAIVSGNRELVERFKKKIDAAIARVWGDAKSDEVA